MCVCVHTYNCKSSGDFSMQGHVWNKFTYDTSPTFGQKSLSSRTLEMPDFRAAPNTLD